MVIMLKILRRNTRGAFAFIVFEISHNGGSFIETRFGYLRKGHQCVSAYGPVTGTWHKIAHWPCRFEYAFKIERHIHNLINDCSNSRWFNASGWVAKVRSSCSKAQIV